MNFKHFISEMAYHQDRAVEKIEDLIPQLTLHLIKCWAMPRSRNFNHWANEIENWLMKFEEFSHIKTKSKLISLKVYRREFSHITNENTIKNCIKIINRRYKKNLNDINFFKIKLDLFFDSLWEDLASGEFDIDKYGDYLRNTK